MKRKFLAKAITLGLMLAVPLGAYAEDIDKEYVSPKVDVIEGEEVIKTTDTITINSNNELAVRSGRQNGNGTPKTIADLQLSSKKIAITSTNYSGISVANGSKLKITADTTSINVSNAKSLKAIEGNASIFSNEINITADNSNVSDTGNSHVIFGNINLAGKDSTEGNLTSANTIKITTRNVVNAIIASSHEMNIKAETLIIDSDTRAFQAIQENSKVSFDVKNADIKGDILALKGGNIQFGSEENPTENVIIEGKLFTQKYGDVSSETKIDIHNKGKLTINGDIDTTSREGGTININQGANDKGILQITGDILTGDVEDDQYQNNSSSVNIKLNGEESFLKGNITDNNQKDGSTVTTGGTNISLSNGATWTTTGDSTVKEVKSNGGVINLAGNDQNVNINNLTNGNISGETPKATTIKTDSINNKLTIGENENKLEVEASSKVTDSMGNDIQGGMKKLLNNINVENGTKETTVTAAAGSVTGETTITRDADGNSSAAKEEVHKENAGISEMASIALMAWRAENNDMNKRLGELRDSEGEHGIWTRMVRGQSKYGAQNVKNQYSTYQLGYDEKLSVDKNWTVGAAVSYTDASSSFSTGHGENKSTGFAVYGSYLSDNGSFVDLIAKAARLKNEFDVLGGAGKGDYETNGYSLSAEYGKRFTKDNGFWIEPQVELTYGYVGAVDYLTNNDVQVRQNGMDSLVGRIGFAMGRNIKAGNVYARASYLYDFDGETDVTFSKEGVTRGFKQDLGGGWWEVGVGTNINLSDATHLYFDVEKTYGGNVATPWQWNAGVRWSF